MIDRIKRYRAQLLTVLAIVGVFLVMAIPAWATDPDPATVVGDGASALKSNLLTVVSTVLPYAAALLAVVIGWRLATRFLRAR